VISPTLTRNDQTVLLRLSNSLRIDRDPDRIFRRLHDPETLAGCVPGVSITHVLDRQTIQARMVVGVGPFSLAYNGTARIIDSDHSSRTASVDLQGEDDVWGLVRARMKLTVRPVADGSSLHTSVQLALTGRTTMLGRKLLQRVADEMFTRTGDRIKRRLEEVVVDRRTDLGQETDARQLLRPGAVR